jgi:hypothetical protein
VLLESRKCGVSTKIIRTKTIRLLPMGCSKKAVYTSKPRTLQDLWSEIEITCAAVPLAVQNICQSVALCCQQCTDVGDGHFEHL